jgi:hypothetical protein
VGQKPRDFAAKRRKKRSAASRNRRNGSTDFTDKESAGRDPDSESGSRPVFGRLGEASLPSIRAIRVKIFAKRRDSDGLLRKKGLIFLALLRLFAAKIIRSIRVPSCRLLSKGKE